MIFAVSSKINITGLPFVIFRLLYFHILKKYMIIKNYHTIKRLGLAYSGGLDTSTAIRWLCKKRIDVYAYHANIEKTSKESIRRICNKAISCGVKKFKSLSLCPYLIKLALEAIRYNAFNIVTGCQKYYNTTPLSRVVIGKYITKQIKADGLCVWSDGSTYKGNDIERFMLYASREYKSVKFYKPWLDHAFVRELGGRDKMEKYLVSLGIKKDDDKEQPYSVDSNILGNTYEGNILEYMNASEDDVDFQYKRSCKYLIKISFYHGIPNMINDRRIKNYKNFITLINKIGGMIGVCDQMEDRIIGTKSRGIYEAPGMHILHNVYERLVTLVHNKESVDYYRYASYLLGSMLYKGQWYCDCAKYIRKSLEAFARRVSGYVIFMIHKNRIKIIETVAERSKYIRNKVSMDKEMVEQISYKDRIGQLNLVRSVMV
ncbi:argininosuccinate synthase [Candidatus Vidania fulgoroideorum]